VVRVFRHRYRDRHKGWLEKRADTRMASELPTVVLVHGAWHGPCLQEGMAKAIGAATTRLDADHSPWLSRPAELAAIIAGSTRP
jgi:hypothetical protein